MRKLLKKEFALCMHPAVPLFLALSTMLLIPNYPYAVSFFYITLGIFFICMSGRENHDISFTMTLPVSRREIVAGRILLCCCLEIAQLLLCGVMILVKETLMGGAPNEAGMDANLALLGDGFLVFALFNLIFFPAWYKDVRKIGAPFLLACAAVFFYIILGIVSTYALPFVRDILDTPDPAHLPAKAAFAGGCLAVYALFTFLAFRLSCKRFERQDLQA